MTALLKLRSGEADVARKALERCIAGGGVAVFPSDGLYGLACDPLDANAISKIHRLKGRDDGKPSAVMYFSPLAIRELLSGLGPKTKAVASALLPGPATLVVNNPERRYPLACRQNPERLGIRLIGGPLGGTMCPVFQTSSNLSGEPAPARFEDVPRSIRDRVELAIDGGELPGLPSTVIDVAAIDEDGSWRVLRDGALSLGDVQSALASVGLD
ncbi:MAG TPA: Sua5/YciO/YrdC/YwlC family protein [Solirubrobacterales bacterium]|nr:Sua5/YciO/YrdC/YwlC family protein [Solirubrobacterales bacterium]